MDKGVEEHRKLHEAGWFPGVASHYSKHAEEIRSLIRWTASETMLDFGSGRGEQHKRYQVWREWGIEPVLYDPAVPGIDELRGRSFHGVLCIDVLEHIEAGDIARTLRLLSSLADRFCFIEVGLSVDTSKHMSDGGSCHVTIRPASWWASMVRSYVTRPPEVRLRFVK